jgi:FlgD Ig-like domain
MELSLGVELRKRWPAALVTRLVGLGFVFLPMHARGAILHVPDQYPTITLAANAAVSGDSVLVDHPGNPNDEYSNEFIVIKPGVSIIGQDHDSTPVRIYSGGSVVFEQGSTPARLEWFNIGVSAECRTIVVSNNSKCEIRFNRIYSTDNPSCPGILLHQGGLVENNWLQSVGVGSGIAVWGNATIRFNVMATPNAAVEILSEGGGTVDVTNNDLFGTGITLYLHPETEVNIVNNLFVGHDAGIWWEDCNAHTSIRYNDFVHGGVWPQNCVLGPGNLFFVDPMFCGPFDDDFYLHASSPLVHAGEGGTYIGALGVGCGVASVAPGDVGSSPRISLGQPCPNPTTGSARMDVEIAAPGEVTLEVFDVMGRHVATPLHELKLAGHHVLDWDGRHMSGEPLRAGVYYLRLSAGSLRTTQPITIVK